MKTILTSCTLLALMAPAMAIPAQAQSYGVPWRANGSYDLPVARDAGLDSTMQPLPVPAPRKPTTTQLFSLTPLSETPVRIDPRLSSAAGTPGDTAVELAPEKQEAVTAAGDPASGSATAVPAANN